jgi:gas vesicle protein
MNNNDHNNGSCDFGETLVSYLYEESSGAESDKFKVHAASCSHCAEELAGFTTMRSSLAQWKQEEFAPMVAPAISLPHEKPVILTDEPVFVGAVSSSFAEIIRGFFTPKIAFAAAGFAALVICFGLGFALLGSQKSDNENIVASNQQKDAGKKMVTNSDTPAVEIDTVAKTVPVISEKIDTPADTAPRATKTVHEIGDRHLKNSVAVNKTRSQDTPRQVKQETKDLNTDIYEETEDDSLRLADLFAEAGTE